MLITRLPGATQLNGSQLEYQVASSSLVVVGVIITSSTKLPGTSQDDWYY